MAATRSYVIRTRKLGSGYLATCSEHAAHAFNPSRDAAAGRALWGVMLSLLRTHPSELRDLRFKIEHTDS